MGWINLHSHSNYSDGKKTMTECSEAAVKKKMDIYGFSDHSPVPYENNWSMRYDELESYISEANLIKEKYKGIVEFYTGLEVDFTPDNPYCKRDLLQQYDFDYIIGSIHFVDNFNIGKPWNIDTDKNLYDKGMHDIFSDNGEKAARRFYELTLQMIEEMKPDIVGHLDKIKMFNSANKYFTEQDSWYRSLVKDVLDVMGREQIIMEINTRGFYKKDVRQFYPSPWIFYEAKKRNVPVIISADSHHPDEMTYGYTVAVEILFDAGFKTMRVLKDNVWQDVEFNRMGLVYS